MPDVSQVNSYARLLHLTPVDGFVPTRPPVTDERSIDVSGRSVRKRWPFSVSFLIVVILPTILTLVYLVGFAADRYQSEARFVLRMPGQLVPKTAMADALQTNGISRSNEDSYIVREFLESRDAMKWLVEHADVKTAYGKGGNDFLWAFPNVFTSNSDEGLYQHYLTMMSAKFDSATGVNTLKVAAFTPSDAHVLATSLLQAAEALVNHLNRRARQDAIGLAEQEENRMRQRALAAQAAIMAFREREQLIDPSQATFASLEAIARLAIEATQASVQISELRKSSPSSPQVGALNRRLSALEEEIAKERRRLAGSSESIAPRIAEYERLMLEREFSDKALLASMTGVELARAEAMRKQVYLERVAEPSLPDYPTHPLRVLYGLAVLVGTLMLWRAWRFIAADARRHNEL